MLSSSREYFRAFREGDVLRFLEWPFFLFHYYTIKDSEQDADFLIDIMICIWLNNDYCTEDFQQTLLLQGYFFHNPDLLLSSFACCFTSMCAAALYCQVYKNLGIESQYYCSVDKMSADELYRFVHEKSNRFIDPALIEAEQKKFFASVRDLSKDACDRLDLKIRPMLVLRNTADKYLNELKMDERTSDDALKSTRISVIQQLAQYLKNQMTLNPSVQKQVTEYVTMIRKLGPLVFEVEYLESLAPTAQSASLMQSAINLGLGFLRSFVTGDDDCNSAAVARAEHANTNSCRL